MRWTRSMLATVFVVGLVLLLLPATVEGQGAKPDKLPPPPDYDVKIFHGSMCQPWSYWSRQIMVDSEGVWNWDEDSNGYVVCPVVRDAATGTDGVHMARITVYDDDPNGDIECTFHAQDKWGVCVDHAIASTSGTPGLQILDLTVTQSAEYGAYFIGCSLPPRTPDTKVQLRAYRIYELQDGYDGMTDYEN